MYSTRPLASSLLLPSPCAGTGLAPVLPPQAGFRPSVGRVTGYDIRHTTAGLVELHAYAMPCCRMLSSCRRAQRSLLMELQHFPLLSVP